MSDDAQDKEDVPTPVPVSMDTVSNDGESRSKLDFTASEVVASENPSLYVSSEDSLPTVSDPKEIREEELLKLVHPDVLDEPTIIPPADETEPFIQPPRPLSFFEEPSSPARPSSLSRAMTAPTRSSSPHRPNLTRASTTGSSTSSFHLPNPFASLLNSQRFFVRIPLSFLPNRWTSFAQQPTFTIPSFFPRPSEIQAPPKLSIKAGEDRPARSVFGTAAGLVSTSVKWGFGWPVLVPLKAGQFAWSLAVSKPKDEARLTSL